MKKIFLSLVALLTLCPVLSFANGESNLNAPYQQQWESGSESYFPIITRKIIKSELIQHDMVIYKMSISTNAQIKDSESASSIKDKLSKIIRNTFKDIKNTLSNSIVSLAVAPIIYNNGNGSFLIAYGSIDIVANKGKESDVNQYILDHSGNPELTIVNNLSYFVSDELMNKTMDALTLSLTKSAYSIAERLDKIKDKSWKMESINMSFSNYYPGKSIRRPGSVSFGRNLNKVMSMTVESSRPSADLKSGSFYVKAFGDVVFRGHEKVND